MRYQILLILSLILSPQIGQARWASIDDLDVHVLNSETHITVASDGSHTAQHKIRYKITKESGKAHMVSYPLYYNARAARFKLIQARSFYEGQAYDLDPTQIEDKPVASELQGFDEQHQLLLAFSELRLGSEVEVIYEVHTFLPMLTGFYTQDFIYGGFYVEQAHLTIDSAIPLQLELADRNKALDIKESIDEAKHYHLSASLKYPLFKMVLDEEDGHTPLDELAWLRLSSLDSWTALARRLAVDYEPILQAALPASYVRIRDAAALEATDVDKFNRVTALLSEHINYMGDWRTVAGAFIPRPLAETARTAYGDCKDFSAALVTILRSMGFDAYPAWVQRELYYRKSPLETPGYAFNHAIVYVNKGQGFWLDPTNFTSFAPNLYGDIAGRPALIIDTAQGTLKHIPTLTADAAIIKDQHQVVLQGQKRAQIKGSFTQIGLQAVSLTGAQLRNDKASIDYQILKNLVSPSKVQNWQIGPYDLHSRIVAPITIPYAFLLNQAQLQTSHGSAYLIRAPQLVKLLLLQTTERVGDYQLGLPQSFEQEFFLPKLLIKGQAKQQCELKSLWFDGFSEITQLADGLKVKRAYQLKAQHLDNQTLLSPAFQSFQEELDRCLNDYVLIYRPLEDSTQTVQERLSRLSLALVTFGQNLMQSFHRMLAVINAKVASG